jgi:hypothetical protein
MALSSYRLGDLVILSNLTEYDKNKILINYPNSFGSDYIKLNLPSTVFTDKIENNIKHMTNIVLTFITNNPNLFPDDIEDSIVIHARLGDVVAGNCDHEIVKRPLDIDFLKSIIYSINVPSKNIYIIGKCHFGDTTFNMKYYDDCVSLSNKYINDIIKEFNAIHFNSDDPDIDLCLAVKSKIFIQGKGNYSTLILEIRKYLNKINIETNKTFVY